MIDAAREAAILDRISKIPIFATLRMGSIVFDEGVCEMLVPRQKMYDGVFESFHGGMLMTVADSAACFAVLTRTPVDQLMTTTDMNIRFLAPCLTDVHVKARVIKFGRLMCPVAVDLLDTAERWWPSRRSTTCCWTKCPAADEPFWTLDTGGRTELSRGNKRRVWRSVYDCPTNHVHRDRSSRCWHAVQ